MFSRRVLFYALSIIAVAHSPNLPAQTYSYDFGTGTGISNNGSSTTPLTSNNFAPQPTSGDDLTVAGFSTGGTGGGSVRLLNPGDTNLGSGSELSITAPTGTSSNKFGIFDYTGGTLSLLSFTTILGGNSGTFVVATGNGTNFSSATSVSQLQTFTGLRFTLGGTVGAPTVTTEYLSGSGYVSTGLTTTAINTGTLMTFTIIGNNATSAADYNEGGYSSTVAAHTFDLYLNDILIGDDLAASRLAAAADIDSFNFQATSSLGNVGTMAFDDITYGTIAAAPEPATWIGGALATALLAIFHGRVRRDRRH
jgi:hypothetical protein